MTIVREKGFVLALPTTLSSALTWLKAHPDAIILAGSTSFPRDETGTILSTTDHLLTLRAIDPLQRVIASDVGLNVGSMVTLGKLLEQPPRRLPRLLFQILSHLSEYSFFYTATVGGNLCLRPRPGDLYLALCLLDASVELRSAFGATSWIDLGRSPSLKQLFPRPGEILTVIKIPYRPWNFARFFPGPAQAALIARVDRNLLERLRFGFRYSSSTAVTIAHVLEETFSGVSLPLRRKDFQRAQELFTSHYGVAASELTAEGKTVQMYLLSALKELSENFEDLGPT